MEIVTPQMEGTDREIILKIKVLEEKTPRRPYMYEQKKQKAEQQSEDAAGNGEFERLVEMSPNPLYVSINGTIAYANNAMLAMLGAESKDEVIGRRSYEFIEEEYHDIVKNRIVRMQKRNGSRNDRTDVEKARRHARSFRSEGGTDDI